MNMNMTMKYIVFLEKREISISTESQRHFQWFFLWRRQISLGAQWNRVVRGEHRFNKRQLLLLFQNKLY